MENQQIVEILKSSETQISVLSNAIQLLQKENERLANENKTWVQVSNTDKLIEMTAVAKVLNYKNLGRNKINAILKECKILRYNREPYQKYVDNDCFVVREQEFRMKNGEIGISRKTMVTQKGVDYIRKVIDKYNEV